MASSTATAVVPAEHDAGDDGAYVAAVEEKKEQSKLRRKINQRAYAKASYEKRAQLKKSGSSPPSATKPVISFYNMKVPPKAVLSSGAPGLSLSSIHSLRFSLPSYPLLPTRPDNPVVFRAATSADASYSRSMSPTASASVLGWSRSRLKPVWGLALSQIVVRTFASYPSFCGLKSTVPLRSLQLSWRHAEPNEGFAD